MAINVLSDTNIEWDYDPIVSKPKKVSSVLNDKYIKKAEKKTKRKATRGRFRIPTKPVTKRGLTIKNGIDPTDTVCIGIAIWDGRKWIPWKLGWTPEVSHSHVRFNFMNGEKRKLQYANVWQYLQDNHVGHEEPHEADYEGHPSRFFKVSFPALEAFDLANGGNGETA